MREFKLINDLGQEFSLMTGAGFFKNPAGLGFDVQIEAQQAGYSYIPVKETMLQKSVTGNMIFATYEDYKTFTEFITAAKSLVLAYKPIDTWYYLDVIVSSLQKGEKTDLWRLNCPITFTALGTWYEAITAKQAQGSGNGKEYDYEYDYVYQDQRLGEVEITGVIIKSPCIVSIFGPVENPSFTLTQNGAQVLTGKVNVTIPAGNKLVINAEPANMEIAEYTVDNTFVADRYANSDFSTERFAFVPAGDSTFYFTDEGGGVITAVVEVHKLVASI